MTLERPESNALCLDQLRQSDDVIAVEVLGARGAWSPRHEHGDQVTEIGAVVKTFCVVPTLAASTNRTQAKTTFDMLIRLIFVTADLQLGSTSRKNLPLAEPPCLHKPS